MAAAQPYGVWLKDNQVHFDDLPEVPEEEPAYNHHATLKRLQAFGYSFEDLRVNIGPMAQNSIQPVGSMGTDTPLAVLSDKPQLLYNYFKQLFAQVTNPPIDPIREELITSTTLTLGSEGNLVDPRPESCRQLRLSEPILKNSEMEKLRRVDLPGIKVVTLPILFNPTEGKAGLEQALEDLFHAADQAIAGGATILILSDTGVDRVTCADSGAAGVLWFASSSDPQRHPDARRSGAGVRRAARSASLLFAAGLRRASHQSLSGLRMPERHDPRRDAANLSYHDAVKGYNKAVVQGCGQGHGEDGHLHH